jgi:signal transduction histidine kinase
VIVVEEEGSRSTLMTADEVRSDSLVSAIPVALTPYGFGLGWSEEENPPRSSQRITWPVGASAGEGRLGYVELSAGPAYGGSILRRVAWGWAAASALAVLLAAVAGVAISRRLSQPLLDLTAVTLRMVAGNLAARANVKRQDELGTLALAFNEMAQRIEATILALRRFVSDAAHALQTPLTVLHSDLDLIRSRTSEAEQLARIERAWSQVLRLEALSAGLLELSRVEAKAGSQQPVSLHTIVKESSQFYASRAEQAGLTLSFDLPETEITILGDGTQLRHALDNLLDNAIKFNREGGAVSVSLRVEAGWNVLQVSDTGIGIPESDRPHLFRRFYRGGNAAETPGSGLGLAIVKAVVEAHAGSVSLESGFQGTTVILRLPVYR